MSKHCGYSRVEHPTAEQMRELEDGLLSGNLARFFIEEDVAYYRRADGADFELTPQPSELERRLAELETRVGDVAHSLLDLSGLALETSRQAYETAKQLGACIKIRNRPPVVSVAVFWLLFFGALLVGAVLALLTR